MSGVSKSVSAATGFPARPTVEDDIRDDPGVRIALAALLAKDPEPMTMPELQEATGLAEVWSRRLRQVMERWGLIRTEWASEGRVRYLLIRLTPVGRKAAEARAAYDGLLLQGRESAGDATGADRGGRP